MQINEIKGALSIPEASPAHGVWITKNKTWHAVEGFNVYCYACMDGGYDTIVNAKLLCGGTQRIDLVDMVNHQPQQDRCLKCDKAIDDI